MSDRKRFWKSVTVEEKDGLYSPALDGRVIRLPGGTALAVRSEGLAHAVAAEWRQIAEGASFVPEDLPLTRITGTMIERIRPDLAAAREALFQLGQHDGLCYVKGEPDEVAQAVFSWLGTQGVHPSVTDGVMPVSQSGAYQDGLRGLLARQGEAELAALGVLAQSFGSVLLALALVSGAVDQERAVALANLDERHQLQVWGQDAELVKAMIVRQNDASEAMTFLGFASRG